MGATFAPFQIIDSTGDPDAPTYFAFNCSMQGGSENDIGQVNGITNLYYENGQLHKESNYLHEERQDITTSWYEGGELKSVCNFKDGKLNGEHKILNKDGSIKELAYYKDGVELDQN